MEDHARNRPQRHRALAPDRGAIDTLADKAAFARYAEANGLAALCPKTHDTPESAVFPCVLKRVDLNAGQGVTLVGSREELEQRLSEDTWRGHPTVLQALAPGFEEYVTHCVCRKGRVLWHCSFVYGMEANDAMRTPANVGSIRATMASRELVASFEAFLTPLAYDGPCNIDYKIAPDGKPVVLEINPRLGGSLMRPENVELLARALSEIIDAAAP
jgi:carbamoylphosphate synthase large subunit